jgi:NTP pyrophosphatase (non-canonical NTP hydrolase)
MNFDEYQKMANKTLINKDRDNLAYFALGIAGEGGEVADKIKKIIRDKSGVLSDNDKVEIIKEVGDVLWYLSQLADYMDFNFTQVAEMNLKKLSDRQNRGVLAGSGDNR